MGNCGRPHSGERTEDDDRRSLDDDAGCGQLGLQGFGEPEQPDGHAQNQSRQRARCQSPRQDLGEDELAALCAIAHTGGQNAWRCIFALAGLPSLPRVLAEAKTYSERLFTFQPIEHLDDPLAVQDADHSETMNRWAGRLQDAFGSNM